MTALGKDQAAAAHTLWTEECAAGIHLPERLYCSPMTRAMQTNEITFAGLLTSRTVVLEVGRVSTPAHILTPLQNCREEYGQHTCDRRRTRTYIRTAFPQFDIEDGLEEEDTLWTAETRETGLQVAARARTVLDRIFAEDKDASGTSHVPLARFCED